MNVSIRMKLLALCILLVLLTSTAISVTYYVIAKQEKQQESQQRILIAFDIILDDLKSRRAEYKERFEKFLAQDLLRWTTSPYNQDNYSVSAIGFLRGQLTKSADELKQFGRLSSASQVALYALDKRLLLLYQADEKQDTVGAYVKTETGENVYLALEALLTLQQSSAEKLTGNDFFAMRPELRGQKLSPEATLPAGVVDSYPGEIPAAITIQMFSAGRELGVQVVAPVYYREKLSGVLVGKIVFRQSMAEHYAFLGKTEVNLFAGNKLSIGTLASQTELPLESLSQGLPCDVLSQTRAVKIAALDFNAEQYYQGQCVLKDSAGSLSGAITVSLSQAIEQRAIRKILFVVLLVSGIASGIALGMSLLFSRKTIHVIQEIVRVIVAAAEGDLRKTVRVATHDEFGMLAVNLNRMIAYLQEMATTAAQIAAGDLRQEVCPRSEYDVLGNAFQNMTTYLQEMAAAATAVAEGDLRHKLQPRTEYDVLGKAFSKMETVRQIMSQMVKGAAQLGQASLNLDQISAQMAVDAKQTSFQVSGVSSNSQKINQGIGEVSSTMEEFAANLREISRNAADVLKIVAAAVKIANSASTTIVTLEKHSQEIGEIVKVITAVAQQTNLLALNATIEAARAGEVGRGFTVVANEVKALAKETTASAEDIIRKVEAIQTSSKETAAAIKDMSQIIHRAHEFTDSIAKSVAEQTDAISQISHNVADVAQGSEEIAHTIVDVAGGAQRTSELAVSVKSAAAELTSLADQLRRLVETFKIS